MKIIFIGTVQFSKHALLKLVSLNANIVGVCTLKKSNYNSDYVDLTKICHENNLNIHYMKNINDNLTKEWIKNLKPDIIFCLGLSQIIGSDILSIPAKGVVGYHPALLPANRGRHPIIWAIALGLKETGSTFFFMDDGADSGDIISQKKIEISYSDNAEKLYSKITKTALLQIEEFYDKLIEGNISVTKQDHKQANSWRKRTNSDGLIDWRISAVNIYNLVRALSKPYIGAHFMYDNKIINVWDCEIIEHNSFNIEPGKVLSLDNEGILVKAGKDAIILKDIEPKISIELGEYL